MQIHRSKLLNICRLCCRRINISKHYKTVKTCHDLCDKILFLFGHDVSIDDSNQYPPNVCEKCFVKLNTVNVTTASHSLANNQIAEFDIHVDGKCTLCKIHKLSEYVFKLIKKTPFGLSTIKDTALKYSFSSVESECTDKSLTLMQRKFDADGFVTSFKSLVVNRVNSGFDWKFYFWDRHITSVMSQMIASLPNFLLAENIDTFFKEINACKLCTGNDDFCDLIACKVEGIHWSNAHLDDRKLNSVKPDNWTIRSEKCELVLSRMHQV